MNEDNLHLRTAFIPGLTPLSSYLTLFACLRDVAIEQGGKLEFGNVESYTIEQKIEDPNDPLAETKFANRTVGMKLSDDVPSIERKEVYDCIDACIVSDKQEVVYESFETRFPEKKWGEKIPMSAVLQIFVYEHLDDLALKND